MKHGRTFARVFITIAFLFPYYSILGCAAKKRVTSVETNFLSDVDISEKRGNLPFDHSWIKPDISGGPYSHIYLKPVRLDFLDLDDWVNSLSAVITSKEAYQREAEAVAKYLAEQIVENVNALPTNEYTFVDRAGPRTLVLEIAIVELEFSRPVARAGALAAPIPGVGAAVSAVTDPYVSFAVRVTDGVTNELIATAADRKFAPARILDINKLTVTSSVREICTKWSRTFAAALSNPRDNVTDQGRYSLLPW